VHLLDGGKRVRGLAEARKSYALSLRTWQKSATRPAKRDAGETIKTSGGQGSTFLAGRARKKTAAISRRQRGIREKDAPAIPKRRGGGGGGGGGGSPQLPDGIRLAHTN